MLNSSQNTNGQMADDALFERTHKWLDSLRVEDKFFGRFKMSASADDTIFSSCFAAYIYQLIGAMDSLTDEQRIEWLEYITSFQDESTGLFLDQAIEGRNLHSGHDFRYVSWQLTTFCLSAIKALGGELKYPLSFLQKEGYNTPEGVRNLLESFNWGNPWGAGNLAMFIGIMLIWDAESNNELDTSPAVKEFFDWHDNFQNPDTGFWGAGKVTEYHNGLFGAYHQYLLYFYAGRDLKYKQTIIDKTLSFQNIDGMFAPQMGGGGCEDIDAIDSLVQLYLRTGYKEVEVKKCLLKAYNAISDLESPNGGFIWGVRKHYGPIMYLRNLFSFWRQPDLYQWVFVNRRFIREQLKALEPRHPQGWQILPTPIDEGDLFSTWFRLLAIAYSSMVIDTPHSKLNWSFLEAPGLGWFKGPEEHTE